MLEDVDLREASAEFRGETVECLLGALEEDGSHIDLLLAPEHVPLGGLLRIEVDREIVQEALEFGRTEKP